MVKSLVTVIACMVIVLGAVMLVSAVDSDEDTLIVEATVLVNDEPEEMVRISVPDFISFGNVSVGRTSSELKLTVNNTGTVDVTITPSLVNTVDPVFKYLYFRDQKTRSINGTVTDVPFERIGIFSFDAAKPTSGNSVNPEDIYMILNLSSVSPPIAQDLIRYTADVRFVAVEA